MSAVTLRPEVTFGGAAGPTAEELAELHGAAHAECFIANSVKMEVRLIGRRSEAISRQSPCRANRGQRTGRAAGSD